MKASQQYCQWLRPGKNKIVGRDPAADRRNVHDKKWSTDGGNQETDEAHHPCGDGSKRTGAAHDGVHPAKQKSPHGTEGAAEISVFAAGLGDGGAKFRERQRAKNRKNRSDDPRGENDGDGAAFASHFGGLQKNTGADHGADDDGGGGPGAQAANEFEAFFSHARSS